MSEFVRGVISIPFPKGIERVPAWLCDGLAVFESVDLKSLDGSEIWRICHVSSGATLGSSSRGSLGFDTRAEAITAARALLALPIDWRTPADDLKTRNGLGNVCIVVQVFCGAFVLEDVMASPPEGSA